MIIRKVNKEDAEKFAHLMQQVDEQSDYMLYEAGERTFSKEKQAKMIADITNSSNSTILVAEEDDQLLGYLLAIGGRAKRNQHCAYLVIGILEAYRGRGIGRKLFYQLEEWAGSEDISRLELTVVTKNSGAVHLYKKMDFEIEGTKRNALKIDGAYVDEYYMAKQLDS
jgi:RimJ/RimL family protein N-acetyltransferase